MNIKHFVDSFNLISNKLINKSIVRVFNSIGSNIFFEFGKDIEIVAPFQKVITRKEWILWIGNASWRISKNEKYFLGSGDLSKDIQRNIQSLKGKKFQSFKILSQFLDMEFRFDEGYQLVTFFNWIEDDQWTLFLPDKTTFSVDCLNRDNIQNIQDVAKHFSPIENYKKIDFPSQEIVITEISYDEYDLPTFHFENDISICLENCTWRLEKDRNYLIGYLDSEIDTYRTKVSELIGKKLQRIDIVNSMMDAKFQIEGGYILKTFSCCHLANQWKIFLQNIPLFSAVIPLSDD